MGSICIVWPRACIGKGRPRFSRKSGRAYTPAATLRAEDDLAAWAVVQGVKPLDGPLRLTVVAEYRPPASWSAKKRAATIGGPKLTKPDVDNVGKLVADALNGIAYADDAQITEQIVRKVYGEQDRTTVIVEIM